MGKFSTAWKAFWAILHSEDKAQAWMDLDQTKALPPSTAAETADTNVPTPDDAAQAVHVLAILQREARLIDFLQEDLTECDDEQIGAAVRKIHDDARDALQKYFDIQPVQTENEGDTVTLDEQFDSRQVRLTGRPAQQPPYTGTLLHKGWKANQVTLPQTTAAVDPSIIAPAEVEIP